MDDLSDAWGRVDVPYVAASDDGGWMNVHDWVFLELEAFGLSSHLPSRRLRITNLAGKE